GGGEGGIGDLAGEDVFVLADEPNNQIVVKAPQYLHVQFKNLINKLDLRRPQVYIDAKIVAITTSDSFRLAAEVQQTIGQFSLNTAFGLGGLTQTTGGTTGTTSGAFGDRKIVNTGLPALTAALI